MSLISILAIILFVIYSIIIFTLMYICEAKDKIIEEYKVQNSLLQQKLAYNNRQINSSMRNTINLETKCL